MSDNGKETFEPDYCPQSAGLRRGFRHLTKGLPR